MQPKIRRINGTWHCLALGVEGLGFNPSDALRDWLARLAVCVERRAHG